MSYQAERGAHYYVALATLLVRFWNDCWCGIGQSQSWDNDTMPPVDTTELPNPILFKKVDVARLCKNVSPPLLNQADISSYLTNGSLLDATYYYVITQYGMFGQQVESVASDEISALIVNGSGHGRVVFDTSGIFAPGTTKAYVYRGTTSLNKHLIAIIDANEVGAMPTSWTDDGTDPDDDPAKTPPSTYSVKWRNKTPGGSTVTRYLEYIDEQTATSIVGRIVYLATTFDDGDRGISPIEYRAVAFYQGLIPKTGYESHTMLLPSEVESTGNVISVKHYEFAQTIQGSGIEARATQVGG